MPTKSELEGRASRIVQVFQKAMPTISTPYPSITVATQRTYRDQRGFLVYKTGSTAISAPTDDQAVELISVAKGVALLVRKEEVPSLDSFYHLLWAALGRFYIGATPPSAVAAMQNITPEDGSVVVGTAFWSVFAPEAVPTTAWSASFAMPPPRVKRQEGWSGTKKNGALCMRG